MSSEVALLVTLTNSISKMYIKVNARQKEWQYWKLTFKTYDFGNSLKGTAEPDSLYRYRANLCKICIRNSHSNLVIADTKITLEDSKFKFHIFTEFDINDIECLAVSVKFWWDVEETPKPLDVILKTMFDEGSMTDFVIKTAEKEFPCHKVVLAARSQYFATMFSTRMKESVENMLHWEDVVDAETVKELLDFIYTSSKPTNISKTCFSLADTAHLCLMTNLKEMCFDEIEGLITIDNVVHVLEMGDKLESDQLKEAAMNFMAENYEESGGTFPGWDKMEPKLAKRLMASLLKVLGVKKIKI